jgi:hypothetical protein
MEVLIVKEVIACDVSPVAMVLFEPLPSLQFSRSGKAATVRPVRAPKDNL